MQIEQLASMPKELPPPTTTTIADAAAASPGLSFADLLRAKWRSRGAVILYAAVGLTLVGCKMFWPAAPRKADASPALVSTATSNKKPAAAAKPSPASKSPKASSAAEGAAKPDAAVAATGTAKKPAVVAATPATAPIASAAAKAAKPTSRPAEAVGSLYIDETHGFSVRFPAGWVIRTFDGDPWVIDAGDVRVGLISVGFSPFPEGFTTESIPPDWIAKKIRKRHDTTLHGQGYGMIGGRKALWSKSTGPLPMTNGAPRMTRVNYVLPIGDGRILELRVAASPEQFDRLVPVMKKAVETFKLHAPGTPAAPADTVANAGR